MEFNIVHPTEVQSLYKVDVLVYTEVSWYAVFYFSGESDMNGTAS